MCILLCMAGISAYAQPIVVTKGSGSGPGTLYAAINEAYFTGGHTNIVVADSVDEIILTEILPSVLSNTDIDLNIPGKGPARIIRILDGSDSSILLCSIPFFTCQNSTFSIKNADLIDSIGPAYLEAGSVFNFGTQIIIWENCRNALIKNVLFQSGALGNGLQLWSDSASHIDSCFFIGAAHSYNLSSGTSDRLKITGCKFGFNRQGIEKTHGKFAVSGTQNVIISGNRFSPLTIAGALSSSETGSIEFGYIDSLSSAANDSILFFNISNFKIGGASGLGNRIAGDLRFRSSSAGRISGNRFGFIPGSDGHTNIAVPAKSSITFWQGCGNNLPAPETFIADSVILGGHNAASKNTFHKTDLISDGLTKFKYIGNRVSGNPTAASFKPFQWNNCSKNFKNDFFKKAPFISNAYLSINDTLYLSVRYYKNDDTLHFYGIKALNAYNLDTLFATRSFYADSLPYSDSATAQYKFYFRNLAGTGRIGIIVTDATGSSEFAYANINTDCSLVVSTDSGNGTGSLAAAIHCANLHPGPDTIRLSGHGPITITGNISVTDPLVLIGNDSSPIVIKSTTPFPGYPFNIGFTGGSTGSIIRGLHFKNFAYTGPPLFDGLGITPPITSALTLRASGITVKRCRFSNTSTGIQVTGGRTIIDSCTFLTSAAGAPDGSKHGIYMHKADSCKITANQFFGLYTDKTHLYTSVHVDSSNYLSIGGDTLKGRNYFKRTVTALNANACANLHFSGNRFDTLDAQNHSVRINYSDNVIIGGDSLKYSNRVKGDKDFSFGDRSAAVFMLAHCRQMRIQSNIVHGHNADSSLFILDSCQNVIIGGSREGKNIVTLSKCPTAFDLRNCNRVNATYNNFGINAAGLTGASIDNDLIKHFFRIWADSGTGNDSINIGSWIAGQGNLIYSVKETEAIYVGRYAKRVTVAGNKIMGFATPLKSDYAVTNNLFPPRLYYLDSSTNYAYSQLYKTIKFKIPGFAASPHKPYKLEFFDGDEAYSLERSIKTVIVTSDTGTITLPLSTRDYIFCSATNLDNSTSEFSSLLMGDCLGTASLLETGFLPWRTNGAKALGDSFVFHFIGNCEARIYRQAPGIPFSLSEIDTIHSTGGETLHYSIPWNELGVWSVTAYYLRPGDHCIYVRKNIVNIIQRPLRLISVDASYCSDAATGSVTFAAEYGEINRSLTYLGFEEGLYPHQYHIDSVGKDGDLTIYRISNLPVGNYTINQTFADGFTGTPLGFRISAFSINSNVSAFYRPCSNDGNRVTINYHITYPPHLADSINDKVTLTVYKADDTLELAPYYNTVVNYDTDSSFSFTSTEILAGDQLTIKAVAYKQQEGSNYLCHSCGIPVCSSEQEVKLSLPRVKLAALNASYSTNMLVFTACNSFDSANVSFALRDANNDFDYGTVYGSSVHCVITDDSEAALIDTTVEADIHLPNLNFTLPIFRLPIGHYRLNATFNTDGDCDGTVLDSYISFDINPSYTGVLPRIVANPSSCKDDGGLGYAVVSAPGFFFESYVWQHVDTVASEAVYTVIDTNVFGPAAYHLSSGQYRVLLTEPSGCTYPVSFFVDSIPGPPVPVIQISEEDGCIVDAVFSVPPSADTAYGIYRVSWFHQMSRRCVFAEEARLSNAGAGTFISNLPRRFLPHEQDTLMALVTGPGGCISHDTAKLWYKKPVLTRTFRVCMRWGMPVDTTKSQAGEALHPSPPSAPDSLSALNVAATGCILYAREQASGSLLSCNSAEAYEDTLALAYYQPKTLTTLFYYDRAGRLTATVPPSGVDSVPVKPLSRYDHPLYPFATTYQYNSLGQQVRRTTPDGGTTRYIYNKAGQLRISCDAQQFIDHRFVYTKYDPAGRVIEKGLAQQSLCPDCDMGLAAINFSHDTVFSYTDSLFVKDSSENLAGHCPDFSAVSPGAGTVIDDQTHQRFRRIEYVKYIYSESVPDVKFRGVAAQRNIAGKLSMTEVYNPTGDIVRTAYSYDAEGNIEWFCQMLPDIQPVYVKYDYDLISGKVLMLSYNPGFTDRYFVRYTYDADNRLTALESSADSITWESDARYSYALHGPLHRTELGTDNVQAMDYAYTVNGWLKGINGYHGKGFDDLAANEPGAVTDMRDAFSLRLDYFSGDYEADNSLAEDTTSGYGKVNITKPLYNGNIRRMTDLRFGGSGSGGRVMSQLFSYDKLNRITASKVKSAYAGYKTGAGVIYDESLTGFNTRYIYDANGNLQKLFRKDAFGDTLDDLYYSCFPKTNRLGRLQDHADPSAHAEDPEGINRYVYNASGQLLQDSNANRLYSWNMEGRAYAVRNLAGDTLRVSFNHDASGNRVVDRIQGSQGGDSLIIFNIRDMQGHVLSTYSYNKAAAARLEQTQIPLYGTDRIGIWHPAGRVSDESGVFPPVGSLPDISLSYRLIGERDYELKDHLGNVRAVVGDERVSVTIPADSVNPGSEAFNIIEPVIKSSYDYYPFGMRMDAPRQVATLLNPGNCGLSGPVFAEGISCEIEYGVIGSPPSTYFILPESGSVPLGIALEPGEYKIELKTLFGTGVALSCNDSLHDLPTSTGAAYTFRLDTAQTVYLLRSDGHGSRVIDFRLYSIMKPYRYLYNGKERMPLLSDVYDYGFRVFDPGKVTFRSVDPLAHKYPSLSPYNYCGNNPINNIDPDGRWFFGLFGSSSAQRQAAREFAKQNDGEVREYFSSNIHVNYNEANYYDQKGNLTDFEIHNNNRYFRENGRPDFRDWERNATYDRQLADYGASLSIPERVKQGFLAEGAEFDPGGQLMLVSGVSGLKSLGKGLLGALRSRAAEVGVQYTKSNLMLGQEMHKAYKAGLADGVNTFKEFRLPSGKRIDFLDVPNGTICELKPFNPRAMQLGQRQLNTYMQELNTMPRFKNIQWKTVLDKY
ncbi:MAG: RHS repeat-associated core domain-containing protein [Bacteroidota bacterium]